MSEPHEIKAKPITRMDKDKKVINKDPLSNLWVDADFYCPSCKRNYKRTVQQSSLRRLPRIKGRDGKRLDPRRPDGAITSFCNKHAEEYLQYLQREGKL